MSQHPNDDLRRLAQLLSTTAAQMLELADELSPEAACNLQIVAALERLLLEYPDPEENEPASER